MFQSSPAPKSGRYDMARMPTSSPTRRFQSSPAPKSGRYIARDGSVNGSAKFQSSPAPKSGRYERALSYVEDNTEVSILARPEERALPSTPTNTLSPSLARF